MGMLHFDDSLVVFPRAISAHLALPALSIVALCVGTLLPVNQSFIDGVCKKRRAHATLRAYYRLPCSVMTKYRG